MRDLLGLPSDGAAWPDPPPVAARLTPPTGEVVGIFGAEVQQAPPWPWAFPAEQGVDGFDGMADGQTPSPFGVEELQKAAVHFAAYALVSPIFFACEGFEALDEDARGACGWASVHRLAQRAWRRPLSPAESDRLQTFWDAQVTAAAGALDEAIALTVAGVLQSPDVLFRVELGDSARGDGHVAPLTGWEMASRLSYLLWDTMPDPELFGAAASGDLDTRAGVESQARRMLDDPKARRAIVRFHEQWLGTDRVRGVAPARREYGPLFGIAPYPALDTTDDGLWPGILGPVRASMEAETRLFIEQVVFGDEGTLATLLTDNRGFMSSATAPIYGDSAVPLDGQQVEVDFDQVVFSIGGKASVTLYPALFPASERAGVLTLPSVLAVGAYAVQPAPILRGKRVLERVACMEFGAPPPGAEAAVPPDSTEAVEATNRTRTEEATAVMPCAGCHDTLNPPGFAFEHYDAIGRWRPTDNGLPVDATGAFTITGGESFTYSDGVELAHQLATSPRVHDCYVLRWARYATGLDLEEGHPGLTPLRAAFAEDGRIRELLIQIATSDLFRFRPMGGD